MARRCVQRGTMWGGAVCWALVAAAAGGQSAGVRPERVLTAGVTINSIAPGSLAPVWTIQRIESLSVNDSGAWAARIIGPATPPRGALLVGSPGGPIAIRNELWATNQLEPVAGLPGAAAARSHHALAIDGTGRVLHTARLTSGFALGDVFGTSVGNLGAVVLDGRVLLRGSGIWGYTGPSPLPTGGSGQPYGYAGALVGAPMAGAPGIGAGSAWGRPNLAPWGDDALVRAAGSTLIALAEYRDPTRPPSAITHALVRLDIAPDGQLLATNLVARTIMGVPGIAGRTIADFGGLPTTGNQAGVHALAASPAGGIAYSILDSTGVSHVIVNGQIVASSGAMPPAETGLVSPFASLLGAPVAVNDAGDWALRCTLADGSAAIIKRVGAAASLVARSGAAAPGIEGALLTAVGDARGPLFIDSAGHVFWYGRFDSTQANAAIFRDGTPVIRQGQTRRVDGSFIGPLAAVTSPTSTSFALDGDADGFAVSPSGRWLAVHLNSTDGATSQSLELIELCDAPGAACAPITGACCTSAGCAQLSGAACADASGTFRGDFTSCDECPPANDACANALELSAANMPESHTIVTTAASDDVGTACSFSGPAVTRRGVWFRFVAPGAGSLWVRETGAQDVVIAFFDGAGGCASPVPAPGPSCQTIDVSAALPMSAGQEALVLVGRDGVFADDTPTPAQPLQLTFDFVAAPAADSCENAADWGSATGALPYAAIGATTDSTGQPACSGATIFNDVWRSWRAPARGTVCILGLSGAPGGGWPAPFSPRIAVYRGDACPPADAAACTAFAGFATIDVERDERLLLRIGSVFEGNIGDGSVELTFVPHAGACCLPEGAGCIAIDEPGCAALGGEFAAAGTWCIAPAPGAPASFAAEVLSGAIPDNNATGWSSTVVIDDPLLVAGDVRIRIRLSHTWVGDLVATIEHEGRVVDLMRRVRRGVNGSVLGSPADLLSTGDYVFWSGAATGFWAAALNAGASIAPGNYRPASSGGLSMDLREAFAGRSAAGEWTLRIVDAASGDRGSVVSWSVEVHAPGQGACAEPTGACCIGAACTIAGSGACAASGGTFVGVSTVCAPQLTCCRANFDGVDGLNVSDIFAFLNAWFANLPSADFDGEDSVTVADIFAFLAAWFEGCE